MPPADISFNPSWRITPRQLLDTCTACVNCLSDHEYECLRGLLMTVP
jgi:hypothetical protein